METRKRPLSTNLVLVVFNSPRPLYHYRYLPLYLYRGVPVSIVEDGSQSPHRIRGWTSTHLYSSRPLPPPKPFPFALFVNLRFPSFCHLQGIFICFSNEPSPQIIRFVGTASLSKLEIPWLFMKEVHVTPVKQFNPIIAH